MGREADKKWTASAGVQGARIDEAESREIERGKVMKRKEGEIKKEFNTKKFRSLQNCSKPFKQFSELKR